MASFILGLNNNETAIVIESGVQCQHISLLIYSKIRQRPTGSIYSWLPTLSFSLPPLYPPLSLIFSSLSLYLSYLVLSSHSIHSLTHSPRLSPVIDYEHSFAQGLCQHWDYTMTKTVLTLVFMSLFNLSFVFLFVFRLTGQLLQNMMITSISLKGFLCLHTLP